MNTYRFIKDGSGERPKNVSPEQYATANYGDQFPLYTPKDNILSQYLFSGSNSYSGSYYARFRALKNTINYHYPETYKKIENTPVSLVCLSSLHLAGGINKGSVAATLYYSGTLIDTATDKRENGILYNKNDEEVGFVLYKEGFFVFTGSQVLQSSGSDVTVYEDMTSSVPADAYRWHHFMSLNAYGADMDAQLKYSSVSVTPTHMTFIYADKLELNHSNNPTYIKSGSYEPLSGSTFFIENKKIDGASQLEVKNTVESPFKGASAPLEKQTFISKIGLYDKENKLIATAHLANPVLKTANREFLFKLKLDL